MGRMKSGFAGFRGGLDFCLGLGLLPGALGRLGDQALLEGARGHAHIADFAARHDGFYALQVREKTALGNGSHVRADTTAFLRFTTAPDDAALAGAFAG